MTMTQSNWRTNEQTTNYMGIINVRCSFRAYCFCINRTLLYGVLFLWISKHEVYSFKIQWKFSAFRHLMQSKQSKFRANENFPRFPSFRFCLWSQIETWKRLKFPVFIKPRLKVTFFLFEVIFLVFGFWVSCATKN